MQVQEGFPAGPRWGIGLFCMVTTEGHITIIRTPGPRGEDSKRIAGTQASKQVVPPLPGSGVCQCSSYVSTPPVKLWAEDLKGILQQGLIALIARVPRADSVSDPSEAFVPFRLGTSFICLLGTIGIYPAQLGNAARYG